jgi:hypothetical protein
MRLEKNWQAHVALWYGQIFERAILKLFEQLGGCSSSSCAGCK